MRDESHANSCVIESASKPLFTLLQHGSVALGVLSLCQRNLDVLQVGLISNVDDGDYWSRGNRAIETNQGDELGNHEGCRGTCQIGDRGPQVASTPGGPEWLVHLATCI